MAGHGAGGEVCHAFDRVVAAFAAAFGDVLGEVRRDGFPVYLFRARMYGADVDLFAPADHQFADGCAVGRPHVRRDARGIDRRGEEFFRRPRGGQAFWSFGSVEAHDEVEVYGASSLVFGNFGERDLEVVAEAGAGDVGGCGQSAADDAHGAGPQFPDVGVPEHVVVVVVARGAQGLADFRGGLGVVLAAAGGPSMVAGGLVLGAAAAGPVDRPEGGCGEGDEQHGVTGGGGDAFATGEAGADELVGVARVESGAGFAAGCTAGAAAHGDALGRLALGGVVPQDAAVRSEPGGVAGQVNGALAAARLAELREAPAEGGVCGEADEVAFGGGEPAPQSGMAGALEGQLGHGGPLSEDIRPSLGSGRASVAGASGAFAGAATDAPASGGSPGPEAARADDRQRRRWCLAHGANLPTSQDTRSLIRKTSGVSAM